MTRAENVWRQFFHGLRQILWEHVQSLRKHLFERVDALQSRAVVGLQVTQCRHKKGYDKDVRVEQSFSPGKLVYMTNLSTLTLQQDKLISWQPRHTTSIRMGPRDSLRSSKLTDTLQPLTKTAYKIQCLSTVRPSHQNSRILHKSRADSSLALQCRWTGI